MIVFSKEAQKYYNSVDSKTRKKFDKMLQKIEQGYGEKVKDISRGIDLSNCKRYKTEHYRIIFKSEKGNYYIKEIGTKNDTKFRKTGFM